MLDTDPTATVDDLEHDLADLDEAEPHVEPQLNSGSASITEDEATEAMAAVLAPPSRTRSRSGSSRASSPRATRSGSTRRTASSSSSTLPSQRPSPEQTARRPAAKDLM